MNEAYRGFYDLLAASVSTAVANGRAYDDQRSRAKALADLDRAKTTFFSNVSHEFRTPLTLMLGPVEDALAASNEPLPPLQRERLEVVYRNGLRLQRLVNSLLDFSRIEAGRVRAAYEPTALADFTAELASNFRSACEKGGLKLRVDCPTLGEPVFVDRSMWEKIVLNLLSNAFKFTFEGEICVTMRRADFAIELRVQDTGTGIPFDEIPLLFERFHRVENARGRTHEGSGIGLALVQELVKLHGGSISATSELGSGTTFIVSIPLGSQHLPRDQVGSSRAAAQPTTEASPFVEEALRWLPDADQRPLSGLELPRFHDEATVPTSSRQHGDDSRPLVLVADDNADMRQYIVRLLGEHYRTEAVPDGEAALAAALQRTPDLVLTDVMMPRLDGFGLLQALRADLRTSGVPVIMLSARAGEESRIEGMQEGADDYLVKPFSAKELLARVTAHLKMGRMRREASEALRASDQHHRLLFEQTADGIFLADGSGQYVDVNRAGCEILGYSREEVLARTLLDMIEPDEWPRVGPEIARFAGGQVVCSEWRFRRNDGSVFVGEITGRQLPDGRVQGILRDVTERRTAEAATRASEERVRSILESMTDGFFVLDHDWRITYINAAGERFLDRTPGDLIGKSVWEEFPGTVGSEFERVYRRVTAARVGESFTAYYPNFDRWYELTANPAPEGLTVYFRDVTEQKLSEERLRASEARRRLALDAAELGTWNMVPATRAIQTDARFRAIFGTTEEWTDYFQALAIIHPDDLPAVKEAITTATRLEDPTPYAVEYRIVHPDGSLRWVFAKGRSTIEGAGPTRQVVSLDGTVADITDRKRGEDALRASENRSRTILDSITDGFFALDRDWRYTYMNPAGERSIDCTPGYLIGKCFWDEYPGTIGSEFERFYRRVAASRISESLTAHYPDLDRWYEITAYPAPEGLSVYFRDVTERRQVEQERQQFAALVDTSSDFIGVAGLDQRGIYLNRAGEELIGLSPGKVTSISMLDCFPESEHCRIIGLIADSEGVDHVVVDTWFRHLKTGQLIPVSWSFLRLRDASGNISGYATVTRDLTERFKAEELLRASEERRRLALDAAELGMWHVDPANRVTKTDARYRAIFGTTKEWTDYLEAVAVIHPDDQPAVLEAVAAATRLENPVPYAIEFRIVHPDGSLRWVLANGRSSFEGAGPTRRVTSFDGTVADITDRKRGEEERERLVARLQEQDQRKDEFLATLAHELRNPLAPIRNGLQIMRLVPGNADATERIRSMMERQVGQMVHLIDDLLDLSRISRGKIDLRKERIELASAVAQAVETSRPSFAQADHELLIEIPPGAIYVDADLTRLTQVFSNLLNNAAKFTERGGRVRLAVQLVGADAVISVTDNGIGIPTHMLAHVFEMFTQVDGNLERSQGGLGIGLSIVQRLVQMHGGSVEARSDGPGNGSEFVVRLPIALSLVVDQPAKEANPVHPTVPLRILIADDNLDSAASLAMLLTLEGSETQTAHDGLEALEVAATFRPDVILLDIGMPRLNGYEVCRRIRQQPWGKNMVVIALTGWGQDEDKRRSLAAGVDSHLVKPVDHAALKKLLSGVTATRA
jgi:PAS domain S-box-containing protein